MDSIQAAATAASEHLMTVEHIVAEAATHYRFKNQDIAQLAGEVAASEHLHGMDPQVLKESIFNAFRRVGKKENAEGAVSLFPKESVTLDHVLDAAGVVRSKVGNTIGAANAENVAILKHRAMTAEPAQLNRPSKSWENIALENKINAGMWGIGALMAAFGVASAAKYSVARDDQGKAHLQWSQIGVAGLQLMLAAGCAYMGVQALHGRSVG